MEQKEMKGYKCTACGKLTYPKHFRCLACKATSFEEVGLGDTGTLITYTMLYALPKGIEQAPPLALGVVEFDHNKVRSMGQLLTDKPTEGMRMRTVWGKLRNVLGEDVYGFKFEPI